MNTYDPADYIVYVSMDRSFSPPAVSVVSVAAAQRLPSGYANGSPRTRLRRTAPTGRANPSLPYTLGGSA